MMDPVDIAWFAGLFEGEGNARVARSGGMMTISMTDKDVIDMIPQRIFLGKIYGPYGPTTSGKDVWRWQLTDREGLARLCLAIAPLLGQRRKDQLMIISNYLYDHLSRPQNCINCGIKYTPNNYRGSASRSIYCSSKCNKASWRQRIGPVR